MNENKVIYLDHASTTPILPSVYEKMKPWLDGSLIGNPSSIHSAGKQARNAIEHARYLVATMIGAKPEEIFFTSGGTESDNLALQGFAAMSVGSNFVVSGIEHDAILSQIVPLWDRYRVEMIQGRVTPDGEISIDDLRLILRSGRVSLVSVMLANNETGVVQPIREVAELCRQHGAALHTDAVQAVGHMGVNVDELGVDMLSLSGHKFGAPDGVGALYIRKGVQHKVKPIMWGGWQERGKRSGTENVAAIVGLGAAAEWTIENLQRQTEIYQSWKDKFLGILREELCEYIPVNGRGDILPNILNISIRGVQSEALLLMMDADNVYISAGSACSAGSPDPSHVLVAMGMSNEEANCAVRISFGHSNTDSEVETAAKLFAKNVRRIRSMYQNGFTL